MKITFTHPTKLLALLAVSGSLLLSACGSGTNTTTTAAAGTVELSGIAATGAPMSGATIVVLDKTGAEVQNCPTACTASADGSFLIPLKAGAQAPLVLRATPVGGGEPQVSVLAEATNTNVNITPITTMIAGRLAPDGDPSKLQASAFDGEKLKAAAKEVVDLLKPLLDAIGTTTDPLTGKFAADGTGLDRVLDSLNVQIQRDAAGNATIEIEIKVNGDDAVPPRITLAPNTTPTSTVNSTNVTTTNVVAAGVSTQMTDFLSRMSTCWNTPHASRVDNTSNPTTVTAVVCKELFVGNEPANYKNNGNTVGPNGSFSGMYKNRGTVTVTFDRPVYEFTRDNGDVIMSYHWSNSLGDEDHDRLVVRIVNGVAKAIGNQYNYDADVKPNVQKRTYNSSSDMNHFSTGYTLFIRNHTTEGSPTFSKVVVTSPRGNTMTLFPSPGSERMVFKDRNGNLTSTSVLRLQWKYDSTNSNLSTNGTDLADVETSLVFARTGTPTSVATPWTDEQIKAIPNVGRWQFVFFDRVTSLPVATQTHSTLSRAQTVAEAKALVWPELTAATITDINSSISATLGGIQLSNEVIDLTNPDSSAVWQVEAGAWAPTTASAFTTRLPSARFTDSSSFRSTARSTIISCSRASGGDNHCDTPVTVGGFGNFASGVVVNALDLTGRSARFVDRSRFYAFYPRNPNPVAP